MIGGLLCRLGRHDPDPAGRWNGGYCFTACRRCGRDMVRSAFGEWHVPKGFRVVWAPPGNGPDLDRMLEAAAPPPPPPSEPIAPPPRQRSPFDFGDFEAEEPPRTVERVPPARSSGARRSFGGA